MTKKLALVTGGTRGIGAAIAKSLKAQGYLVVANYVGNSEKAEKFKAEFGIDVIKFDVSDYEACQKAIAELQEKYNTNVSCLVNNAGITRDAMLHKLSLEDWQAVINTNLSSLFNTCKAVVPAMREAKWGRIINISSINAQTGQLGQTNYSAAKAGIIGFTKALALESAVKNITVNSIAPGYINTDMMATIPEKFMEQLVAKIPAGRLGEAEEIARTVSFLAAEDAGYITGATLSINGGLNMA